MTKSKQALLAARTAIEDRLGKPSDSYVEYEYDSQSLALIEAVDAILEISTRIDFMHIAATAWWSYLFNVDIDDDIHPHSRAGGYFIAFNDTMRLWRTAAGTHEYKWDAKHMREYYIECLKEKAANHES